MKFLKKSLITTLLAVPVLSSQCPSYNVSQGGAFNRDKIIEVALQQWNSVYNVNSGCKESEYIVYWNECVCDGTPHRRAVGWRRATPETIPQKNGPWYEARIFSKKGGYIVVRSEEYDKKKETFYDVEVEDRKKHPKWETSTQYISDSLGGEVPRQKFKRILDPEQ